MTFICPKCGRYGMEWDGLAKILICHYRSCSHVIRANFGNRIPDDSELSRAISAERRDINLVEAVG